MGKQHWHTFKKATYAYSTSLHFYLLYLLLNGCDGNDVKSKSKLHFFETPCRNSESVVKRLGPGMGVSRIFNCSIFFSIYRSHILSTILFYYPFNSLQLFFTILVLMISSLSATPDCTTVSHCAFATHRFNVFSFVNRHCLFFQ